MARYGRFECFGECLWYGSTAADARSMVLDLIVDDGVPSRGRPGRGGSVSKVKSSEHCYKTLVL